MPLSLNRSHPRTDPKPGRVKFSSSSCSTRWTWLENALLIFLPGYYILSVRNFFSMTDALAAMVLVFLGALLARKRLSAHANAGLIHTILLLFTVLIFFRVIWNIYDIDMLLVYPDTRDYLRHSALSLFSGEFWFVGERPFVTSLIFKLFKGNWALLNKVYIISFLGVVLMFGLTVVRFVAGQRERLVMGYVLVYLFSNQQCINLWLSCALSELPAIVMTLMLFSLYGLLYVGRPYLEKSVLIRASAIVVTGLVLFFYTFTRDTNMYFLFVFMVFVVPIFRGWSARTLTVLLIAGLFFGHHSALKTSGRWKYPLANVIMWRILPDAGLRGLFQEDYHLPADALVLPCANKWAYDHCPGKEILVTCRTCGNYREHPHDWVSLYGMGAYSHFLLTHPGYVLGLWIRHWNIYNAELWSYAPDKVKSRRLNDVLFRFPGSISLVSVVATLLFGCIFLRKYPMILLALGHACIMGLVSLHGDVMEFVRHYQQAAMTLKISYVLCLVHMYGEVKVLLLKYVGDKP